MPLQVKHWRFSFCLCLVALRRPRQHEHLVAAMRAHTVAAPSLSSEA